MGTQLARARRDEDARDHALMTRASRGDKVAMEALYRQYCDRVYQSALRICREPEDAIDATQDTFLNVFRRLEKLEVETLSFRDYLFASARNSCFKLIAKRKRVDLREVIFEPEVEEADDANSDPERSLLIGDQQRMVRHASSELSARHYQALVLFELDGLGYAEIGEQLGLDSNAVGQLILRARQRLRREVRRGAALKPDDRKRCARALALLPKKAEGQLSKRESEWLDPHLESCQGCVANLSLMQEVGVGYRSVMPPALIALIWQRTDSALALTGSARVSVRSSRLHTLSRVAIPASSLLAILIAVSVSVGLLVDRQPRSASSGESGQTKSLSLGLGAESAYKGTGSANTGMTKSTDVKKDRSEGQTDGIELARQSLDDTRNRSSHSLPAGRDNKKGKHRAKSEQRIIGGGSKNGKSKKTITSAEPQGSSQESPTSSPGPSGTGGDRVPPGTTEGTGTDYQKASYKQKWKIPEQIPKDLPPLPSIKDAAKPKMPQQPMINPKDPPMTPCQPWPQCMSQNP